MSADTERADEVRHHAISGWRRPPTGPGTSATTGNQASDAMAMTWRSGTTSDPLPTQDEQNDGMGQQRQQNESPANKPP